MAERVQGVIETLHLMPGWYGGSYGVILGDDGERYLWSDRAWFRNRGQRELGTRVFFEAVAHSFADRINSVPEDEAKLEPGYAEMARTEAILESAQNLADAIDDAALRHAMAQIDRS